MAQCKTCPLLTKGGKYLTVRTSKIGLKLVAEDFQDSEAPELVIHEKDTTVANVTTREIAFRLMRGNEYYSIKVVGTDLKVEKTMNENHSFTNDHWFKKINLGGDHFGLQTMNHYYLACQNDYSYSYDTVFLCQNVTECVQCREALTTSSPSPCTT
ncbi:hypothetical protein PFLUV_G00074560 [Perca fluviatilis]|uniref:Uncharacterized protein n=1 Tax=Perca fluviatilis TaxID=8168 RepID=A0A6A5F7N8_PERFL|nr:hypothetical protein PFLUV_G00074560 [Perca fluviatilis]